MALKAMGSKPSDEELIPIYLLEKERLDKLPYFDEKKGEYVTPKGVSYNEDCVKIGKIDFLCKVLQEFDFSIYDKPASFFPPGELYMRIAETLARIGNKDASKTLVTSNFHTHNLWLLRESNELIKILKSDHGFYGDSDENYSNYLNTKIAIKALSLMKEKKAIEALEYAKDKEWTYGYTKLNVSEEVEAALEQIC